MASRQCRLDNYLDDLVRGFWGEGHLGIWASGLPDLLGGYEGPGGRAGRIRVLKQRSLVQCLRPILAFALCAVRCVAEPDPSMTVENSSNNLGTLEHTEYGRYLVW